MEQATQQNAENKLPTKTKIAAWWMMVVSGIGIISFIILYSKTMGRGSLGFVFILIWFITVLLPSFFLLISGSYILKRKGWAWELAVIIFSIVTVGFIFIVFIAIANDAPFSLLVYPSYFAPFSCIPFLLILPSYVLLLLDRKNFFKIAP